MSYRLMLVGGPKDGHSEIAKNPELTLEYYTSPGRIAVYREESDGRYMFEGYKNVLKIDAPPQKLHFIDDFDSLEDRNV